MACLHKFYNELTLEHLDYSPTTLIIGTFNPGWDHIANAATWFYGRTHDNNGNQNNNFWDVLPKIYSEPSLINGNVNNWKEFCSQKLIAITDVVAKIDDADPHNQNHVNILGSVSDDAMVSKFYDFELVNLVRILRRYPTISNVYITRTISQGFWRNAFWSMNRYAEGKYIRVASILTPSGYAYYQQGRYNKMNPNNILTLPEYIFLSWSNVWHQID
jgi:hypothetical protein